MPVSTIQMFQYSPADGTWDLIPGFEGELSVNYWENIFPPEAVCWWAVGWQADQIVYYAWEATNACSGEVMMPGVVGELPGPPGTQGPPGPIGPEGPPGPALKFLGSWINTATYNPGDVVTYDAGSGLQTWVCNTGNTDSPPSVTNVDWALLPSTPGATGPQGPSGATGATGGPGPAGPAGPTGATGPPGVGVPTGGATAAVLTKNSPTNYDASFLPLPVTHGIPAGGLIAQSLVKNTATDYDAAFQFQGLPVFASAAVRDSQWTSPPNGATCVTLDTGAFWQYFSALSLWYKPNTVLSHVPITAQILGIGLGGVQIATTGTVLIPANRRIAVTGKIYCEFEENGGWLQALMDGVGADTQLARDNQTDPLIMFGESMFTPSSGGHTFSLNAASLTGTMNVRGDQVPGWMEVRDWGSV